jgi:hypothetical protein
MGTPGCTGGGVGLIGALYTGRGPVCGTIMRGAGGGGATGRGATGDAAGALAVTTGAVDAAGGACIAGGVTRRGGAATGGEDGTGVDIGAAGGGAAVFSAGGTMTGRGGTTGAAGGALMGATGDAATGRLTTAVCGGMGFSTGGATGAIGAATGRGGIAGAAASFFCVIAFSTSPGREMCDRSILVLISSSPRLEREIFFADDELSPAERMWARTFSASCSSRELECVFFSVTPTSASVSRIALLLTSSSRARSLIRTLLIRPFILRVLVRSSLRPHGVSFFVPTLSDSSQRAITILWFWRLILPPHLTARRKLPSVLRSRRQPLVRRPIALQPLLHRQPQLPL